MDHQGQFDSVFDNLRKDKSKLKSIFSTTNAGLQDSKFLNEKISARIETLEEHYDANNQYSPIEYFEISGILNTFEFKDVLSTVLNIFDSVDDQLYSRSAESYHCMLSQKSSKDLIIKLN